MAIAKAYGSITIVDIGDLGTLSVYPESNQPTSVIYDPNIGGGTYNPDWTSTNLQLTPVIYYGGTQIDATNAAISVVWQRKVGNGDPIAISASNGESMSGSSKKLTVNKNVLNSSDPIITYMCTVTYEEPQTGTELTAKGQISFSLISQPTSIKSCAIVGESVFLYNGDKTLKGAESIILTAKLSNCDVANWQYKDANGNWQTISGQVSTALTVNAKTNTAYFVNDVATIRLNTNIDTLYDLHSITNIYDGAAGTSTFAVALSNEDMYVPCDKDGNVLTGGLDNAFTEIVAYNGNDNVTNDSKTSITVATSGVTGQWVTQKTNDDSDTNKPKYQVTGMSAMTGIVTFTVTYTVDGKSKIVNKIFYLTKLLAGNDGNSPEIYSLELTTVTLNKTAETHIYSPANFTAKAYKTVGSTKTPYNGRFKLFINDNSEPGYTSSNDEPQLFFTPTSGREYSSMRVELYKAGGTTTRLDTQTVTVISDGQPGGEGAGGLNFVLGNQADLIPCGTDGKVSSRYELTIPFAAYQGTNRVACTATLPTTLPSGMSVKSNVAATTSANGIVTIEVSNAATLGGTTAAYDTGAITITLTTTGLTVNQSTQQAYTWTKNRQAASGANAVLLRAYAPNGNIINNGENDVTLSCTLTEGTNTVTPTSYKWYVFDNTLDTPGYVQITSTNTYGGHTGYTTNTLTVPATAVSSYASYCIEVTYGGKSYKDYIAVQDKTDPLQVEIFSTLGDKITNSVGVGCIYARVYQNGTELDELQNLKVSATEPSSPLEGDVWAHIDQSTEKIILKKRQGSSWTAFTLTDTDCNYKWTFGDYDGVATNLHNQANSTAKFLYIQGSYITKKMQFNLEVTKQ